MEKEFKEFKEYKERRQETGDRSQNPGDRRPARGRAKISARRGSLFPYHFDAPDLSRAVDDPPPGVSKLPRPTIPWAMEPARMAQIRRGYDIGGSGRRPRRDFRPTARWASWLLDSGSCLLSLHSLSSLVLNSGQWHNLNSFSDCS
jgi:hypothetical protein